MPTNQRELKEWLLHQLPPAITSCETEVTSDEDEMLVILHLDTSALGETKENERKRVEQACIVHYRAETKALRIQLAREIHEQYGYTVTWGMRAGKTIQFFTNNQKPVMTRLSYYERRVLDTLIAANVANTRSAALAYIVRTFAAEHQDWLDDVQEALVHVEQLRQQLRPVSRQGPPIAPITLLSDSSEQPKEPPTL